MSAELLRPHPLRTRRRVDRVLFATAIAVNLVLLYWPWPVGVTGVPLADKIVHATVFAAVAWTGRRAGVRGAWLAGLLVAHAVTSELLQHAALPGRSGDPADVVADVVGVAIGLIGGSWGNGRATRDRGADREAARRDTLAG